MDELVGLLTREKLLLERVLFRSVELRLMMGAESRFVAWASTDLVNASEALRDAELRRAVIYSRLADEHRWPAEPFDWDALEAVAGEPFATILRDIHGELRQLTIELQSQLAAITQLGDSGLGNVTEFLERIGSSEALLATAGREPDPAGGKWAQQAPTPRVNRTL